MTKKRDGETYGNIGGQSGHVHLASQCTNHKNRRSLFIIYVIVGWLCLMHIVYIASMQSGQNSIFQNTNHGSTRIVLNANAANNTQVTESETTSFFSNPVQFEDTNTTGGLTQIGPYASAANIAKVIEEPSFSTTQQKTKNRKKKLFFALHIGPSKTGTTTIQKDSAEDPNFTRALQNDNTIYVGKFAPKSVKKSFEAALECTDRVINTTATSINGSRVMNFSETQQRIKEECWGGHDTRNMIQSNIIDSNEQYSTDDKLLHEDIIPRVKKIFIDYLDYDEIIIIGSYRRYALWLQSAYNEQIKQICSNVRGRCRSIWKIVGKWIRGEDYASRKFQHRSSKAKSKFGSFEGHGKSTAWRRYYNLDSTLLPIMSNQSKEIGSGIVAVAANLETAMATNKTFTNKNELEEIKFDILNYFQLPNDERHYNSITTELYCKSLGMERTPNACRYNKGKNNNVIEHVGSKDAAVYRDIVAEAENRGFITNLTTTKQFNSQIEELKRYHKETLGMNWTSLPLACPKVYPSSSKNIALFTLLEKSLAFEKLIMPGFFNRKLGLEEHIQWFRDFVIKKKVYCWLNTTKLFEYASSWDDILHKRMVIDSW